MLNRDPAAREICSDIYPSTTDHNPYTSMEFLVKFSGCAPLAKAKRKHVKLTHIWQPCLEGKFDHLGSFAFLTLSHGE